ncbi:MAG: hypothetical protein JNL61_02340 [Rhizobiaceae bacterium]|nr:hypothetical protein [Rhizobiaceae bacterium]
MERGPGAPGDRRFQALALTAQGKALVPELAALADANDAEFFGHLPPEERHLLELKMRELARRHDLHSAPVD